MCAIIELEWILRIMNVYKDNQVNIFEYTDYRLYLYDYYHLMKRLKSQFSFRFFSRMAGLQSPNYLKLVMDGQRNLTPETTEKFIKAIKLNKKEAGFFRTLVMQNQASTIEEKDFYTQQIFKHKSFQKLKPLSQDQYDYYSEWYHLPLRELVLRSDFINDPKWIANQFTPKLTEKQAKEAMELLFKLKLIRETKEGVLEQTNKAVESGDAVFTEAVKVYHKTMIQMGAESIDRFQPKDRNINSMTMGVSQKTLEKVQQALGEFQKQIVSIVSEDDSVEEVVQLNLQLFPLAQKGEEL